MSPTPPAVPPFQRCFSIDCDLCVFGIQRAVSTWKTNYDSLPSILWVPPSKYAYANSIVDQAFRHLTVLCDPAYPDSDWWSVGTRTDRGFGSIGA